MKQRGMSCKDMSSRIIFHQKIRSMMVNRDRLLNYNASLCSGYALYTKDVYMISPWIPPKFYQYCILLLNLGEGLEWNFQWCGELGYISKTLIGSNYGKLVYFKFAMNDLNIEKEYKKLKLKL